MYARKYSGWAALGLSIVLFAACEDPTNVGEQLVGGIEGQPETRVVFSDSLEAAQGEVDITQSQSRILAGRVADPSLGTISATGFLDFAAGVNVPSEFRSATSITSAQLRMVLNYTYGDTAAVTTLRLNQLPTELKTSGIRADTTIPAGTFIREFQVRGRDSLVTVDLPASWLTANNSVLRSTTFATDFHGFSIDGATDQAVFGFQPTTSGSGAVQPTIILRVVAGGKTVDFAVSQRASTISRADAPALPAGRVLLQDGLIPAVHIDFDFAAQQDLRSAAINRAAMSLTADAGGLITPANFYRPPLRLLLYAEYGTGDALVTTFQFREGRYVTATSGAGSSTLARLVQQILLDRDIPDRFRIEAAAADNTINAALFYAPAVEDPDSLLRPQIRLTVTPTL